MKPNTWIAHCPNGQKSSVRACGVAEHVSSSLLTCLRASLLSPSDAWIIGVDDHNTDNSEEVIRRHLGHIPGQIVIVCAGGQHSLREYASL
jgi:hypothetical protein